MGVQPQDSAGSGDGERGKPARASDDSGSDRVPGNVPGRCSYRSEPNSGAIKHAVVHDGNYVGLTNGKQTLILRSHTGVVVQGCEALVDAIINRQPFNVTEAIPREIIEAIKLVVMPPDGVCDGSRPVAGGND